MLSTLDANNFRICHFIRMLFSIGSKYRYIFCIIINAVPVLIFLSASKHEKTQQFKTMWFTQMKYCFNKIETILLPLLSFHCPWKCIRVLKAKVKAFMLKVANSSRPMEPTLPQLCSSWFSQQRGWADIPEAHAETCLRHVQTYEEGYKDQHRHGEFSHWC